MGFMQPDTPIEDLPLLIDFEAKSIAKKFPMAKERMEQLYVEVMRVYIQLLVCNYKTCRIYVVYILKTGITKKLYDIPWTL